MTKDGQSEDRIRAYHEAGHCFGLWTLGRSFRYTTLRPRASGFDGLTVLYRRWDFDEAYPLAVVALCGPLAELIHQRAQSADRSPETETSHLRAIAQGGHDGIAKCRMLLHDAEKLNELGSAMRRHWDGISLLADELLEKRTLSGRRVFEIFDGTGPGVAETPN